MWLFLQYAIPPVSSAALQGTTPRLAQFWTDYSGLSSWNHSPSFDYA